MIQAKFQSKMINLIFTLKKIITTNYIQYTLEECQFSMQFAVSYNIKAFIKRIIPKDVYQENKVNSINIYLKR